MLSIANEVDPLIFHCVCFVCEMQDQCMSKHSRGKVYTNTTNDQNMISMHNHDNTQNLVLIGVQNNEKMPFGQFIKHLECTHTTYVC